MNYNKYGTGAMATAKSEQYNCFIVHWNIEPYDLIYSDRYMFSSSPSNGRIYQIVLKGLGMENFAKEGFFIGWQESKEK